MALRMVARAALVVGLVLFAAVGAHAQASFAKGEVVLDVQSPTLLAALERQGFGLATLLGQAEAGTLRELNRDSAAFRTLADAVGQDVTALRQDMQANGRTLYEVTDQNVGRVIDLRWLQSPLASFRLVGVINRIDRKDFSDVGGEPSCGEVRLIYRLAYRFQRGSKTYASRMPFNLNVVFAAKGEGEACRDFARTWVPDAEISAPDRQVAWLLAGPLARSRLVLKQIEVNAQVVRFPSGMETEFGGQAVYLLRIFAAGPSGPGLILRPKLLENTPDVTRLKQDAALRDRLVAFIKGSAAAIDGGVFQLPDEFLAVKALSFSTFGSARLANTLSDKFLASR